MTKKRGVNDILAYVKINDLISKVQNVKPIPYNTDAVRRNIRDRALLAMLILTGLRISEILSIMKSQFDFKSHLDFVVIRGVRILKRRKDPTRVDIPLAKVGILKPLTDLVMKHYAQTRNPKLPLFRIGRHRAWEITQRLTGKWNHYYRSQKISHLINDRRLRPIEVAKILGIKKTETITHYDKTEWEDHKDAFKPE